MYNENEELKKLLNQEINKVLSAPAIVLPEEQKELLESILNDIDTIIDDMNKVELPYQTQFMKAIFEKLLIRMTNQQIG